MTFEFLFVNLWRESYGFKFNLEFICAGEFFQKRLKLREPLRRVQFQMQINFKLNEKSPTKDLIAVIISHSRKRLWKFPYKIFVNIFLR